MVDFNWTPNKTEAMDSLFDSRHQALADKGKNELQDLFILSARRELILAHLYFNL